MPSYLFENPRTGEVVEVVQKINDPHVFVDDDGVEYNRVWTVPNTSVDSQLDGSEESFMKYTQNRKGTMGDLFDVSKECSKIRESKEGQDPLKGKYFKDYSKKRRGMKHNKEKKSSKHWDT